MHGLSHNFQFAVRRLRKTPVFAVTVILTLALGIGATTAIFSLVEGILLRPLPFSNPDRLVLLGDHLGSSAGVGVTAREIPIYTNAASAFSSLGGFHESGYELSGGPTPEQVESSPPDRRSLPHSGGCAPARSHFYCAGRSRASAAHRAQLRPMVNPLPPRPACAGQCHRA